MENIRENRIISIAFVVVIPSTTRHEKTICGKIFWKIVELVALSMITKGSINYLLLLMVPRWGNIFCVIVSIVNLSWRKKQLKTSISISISLSLINNNQNISDFLIIIPFTLLSQRFDSYWILNFLSYRHCYPYYTR